MSQMPPAQGLSASRFYMWRALIALAHVDGGIPLEQMEFIRSVSGAEPLSNGQRQTLLTDIGTPRRPGPLYAEITDAEDRLDFFTFARAFYWYGGDRAAQEMHILKLLGTKDGGPHGLDALAKSRRRAKPLAELRAD